MLSVQDWHNRFILQAEWTKNIRQYLFNKAHINKAKSILDIGCGTGAIIEDMPKNIVIHGLDIDCERLQFAKSQFQDVFFHCSDAHHIPCPNNSFSIVLCHFLLLWVESPERIIQEMIRVGEPGGHILILAEPDYGGRIDYPEELEMLGKLQVKSLKKQGADPNTGRKLAKWLYEAGVKNIELGILGGQWKNMPSSEAWMSEWETLESDLGDFISQEKLHALKKIDMDAWEKSTRVLFVPTFYAVGIIPE